MAEVYITECRTYDESRVKEAMAELLEKSGLLSFVKPDMTIGIKANLVSFMKPDAAATTHPTVLKVLCDMINEKGAKCIIGDSPGGLYNSVFVGRVYSATGMKGIEKEGVSLNRNFETKTADFPEAMVAKTFEYTAWLDECDAIINFCKLKTHGMMGLSAAAKNLFGIVPGTVKPEYHFRFPDHEDFARMIVDLNEFLKPCLSICDAVVGMEGNGPTAGTPREIGCLIASTSPHKLDLVCAEIIGIKPETLPILMAAKERGLIEGGIDTLDISGDVEGFKIPDYERIETHTSLDFKGKDNILGTVMGNIIGSVLASKPKLKRKECVGCKECMKICPAKAIVMVKDKPKINRKECIRCFCCQEFCPKGALKVKRPLIAKILSK